MSGAPRSPSATIFVVEDDPDVGRIVCKVLGDFGYPAEWFRSGRELQRRLRSQSPDLCIVDLGLPDIDGMDLVSLLRTEHGCGVLILTGRGYTADRVMGLELGADDYIVKPFEPRELIARIRSILRRCVVPGGGGGTAHRLRARFSGWQFEVATNSLRSPGGEEHRLSTAEAQLLKVFLEQPNRILTREQLLGERDLSPFDRSIDVRISRLRRKLEADASYPKLIKTVYGAGYLLATTVEWQ